MKKKIFIIVGIVLFTVCGLAYCANGPWPVTIELDAQDEDGNPIAGAEVFGGTIVYKNWEDQKTEKIAGETDSEGKYKSTIETAYTYWVVVRKEGYYSRGTGKIYYQRELEQQGKERGAPITVKRELIMRKVLNPVPLIVVEGSSFYFRTTDTKQGFDLEKMDWVAPHGKGEKTDIYFEWKGYEKGDNDFDVYFVISFPNEGDGLIAFDEDKDEWRFAPESGYIGSKEWRKRQLLPNVNTSNGKKEFIDELGKDKNDYFLRIRTILDKDGKVVRANYARIMAGMKFDPRPSTIIQSTHGVVKISYFFNPEFNNRSLERGIPAKYMRLNEIQ